MIWRAAFCADPRMISATTASVGFLAAQNSAIWLMPVLSFLPSSYRLGEPDDRENGPVSKRVVRRHQHTHGAHLSELQRRSHEHYEVGQRLGGSISARAEELKPEFPADGTCGVDLRVGGGARSAKCGSCPCGSISAWAEEPGRRACRRPASRVDLRVGGGAISKRRSRSIGAGRSPRGRRSRSAVGRLHLSGSISAWAEEPCTLHVPCMHRAGSISAWAEEPRQAADQRRRPRGSISAWAEEPRDAVWQSACHRVDLRVGGGACSLLA